MLFDRPAVTGLLNVLRPFSRGRVRLASADPFAQPAIQPNLFADERDLALLLAGAKLQRRIFETAPLSPASSPATSGPAVTCRVTTSGAPTCARPR